MMPSILFWLRGHRRPHFFAELTERGAVLEKTRAKTGTFNASNDLGFVHS